MQARQIDCSLLMTIQQTTQFKIFKTEIICYLISGCTFDKTCSCDRTKLIHCYYFSILFLISILFKQFKTVIKRQDPLSLSSTALEYNNNYQSLNATQRPAGQSTQLESVCANRRPQRSQYTSKE